MGLERVNAGNKTPSEVNVIIEIAAEGHPVKYEIDKDSETLHVDRILSTPMVYPANYGYIPLTLADDGDPVDVLVITPYPLLPGSVVAARPLGMLNMSDEKGEDVKLIAVPVDGISLLYQDVKSIDDLPKSLLQRIEHFFAHYKDLESGKWVKIEGWEGIDRAHKEIEAGMAQYQATS